MIETDERLTISPNLREVRCVCGRMLFRANLVGAMGSIEIKCSNCKAVVLVKTDMSIKLVSRPPRNLPVRPLGKHR